MTNKREEIVKKKLRDEGWIVIRGGAPDFLCIKKDKGNIVDFQFIEVKPSNGKLRNNQKIYRFVLSKILSAKYSLIKISNKIKKDDLICFNCGKQIFYKGRGPIPKYCIVCAPIEHKKQKIIWKEIHKILTKEYIPLPDSEFKYNNEALTPYKRRFVKEFIKNKYYDSCPICKSKEVEYDYFRGEIVCKKCGLVTGEINKQW